MIITTSKPFEEVLKELEGAKSVFIVGCGSCATTCETGGEPQVAEMKAALEAEGKTVTGTLVYEEVCHELNTKRKFRESKDAVEAADGFLVMACGAACQSVREATEKGVHPACNTVFLGNIQRLGNFNEKCSLCGDCVLEEFASICPMTRCHKGILNGPCGGTDNGKCETDREKDCAWTLIYNQLEKEGRLDIYEKIHAPKNFQVSMKPGRVIIERGGE
jgi:ferredoxin